MDLANRTVVVTGAARGIGAALAARVAAEGARVIGIDTPRAGSALRAGMEALSRANDRECIPIEADVTDTHACMERLQDAVKKVGRPIDGFVHNAGITRDKTFRNMPRETFDAALDVNVRAVMRLNNALLATTDVLAPACSFVHMGSINGIAGAFGQTNYGFSKAALIEYSKQWSSFSSHPSYAIAPGFIETEMTAAMPWVQQLVGSQMCALAQPGLPQDVAATTAFMLSPAALSLDSTSLRVCGGHFVGA